MKITKDQIRQINEWVSDMGLVGLTYERIECEDFIDGLLFQYQAPDFLGEVEYSSGATKVVFIGSDVDYVIKVPITMMQGDLIEEAEDYDDCVYEDDYEYQGAINPFTGECMNDYCWEECLLYRMARKMHVEKFFLPMYKVGENVYIQPKATSWEYIEEDDSNPLFQYSTKEEKIYARERASMEGHNVKSPEMVAHFFLQYTEEDVMRMLAFMDFNQIGDMHEGNWGINDKTQKFVIIDYGSFRDS